MLQICLSRETVTLSGVLGPSIIVQRHRFVAFIERWMPSSTIPSHWCPSDPRLKWHGNHTRLCYFCSGSSFLGALWGVRFPNDLGLS